MYFSAMAPEEASSATCNFTSLTAAFDAVQGGIFGSLLYAGHELSFLFFLNLHCKITGSCSSPSKTREREAAYRNMDVLLLMSG